MSEINKTDARKLALKIEADEYEPTTEEVEALVEYGFLTHEEAEEKYGMEAGAEAEVEAEAEDIDEVPARSYDGPVLDIRGKVIDFIHEDIVKDDEAKTPDIAVIGVVVEDLDGEEIAINIPTKTKLNYLLYRIDTKGYINGLGDFNRLTVDGKHAELARLIAMDRQLWFRTITDDNGENELFATVTPKYQKKTINDILPVIKEELGETNMHVIESNGKHGGLVKIETTKDEIMKFTTEINMGPLDGLHAIQIVAHGQVLFCQNQLTMEVQNIFKGKLPKLNFGARQVHAGSAEELRDTLGKVLEDIKAYRAIIEDGKGIQIPEEVMAEVLDFYKYKGMMSGKVKDLVANKWLDDEIQQVPGTVWGLAMAVTWVGTHENDEKGKPLTDGVRHQMSKIGAEILVASQFWEEYMQMVVAENTTARVEEMAKQAEKEMKKAAKEAAKAAKHPQEEAEEAKFEEVEEILN